MKNNVEVQAEIGLCTKEMAHKNPLKDFEILIEEYKGKWSDQMYEYFKECVEVLKEKEKALETIKKKGIDYRRFLESKNYDEYNEPIIRYCLIDIKPYTQEEYDVVRRMLLHD